MVRRLNVNAIDLTQCDSCRNVFDPLTTKHDIVSDKYGVTYWLCDICLHGHSAAQLQELVGRGD
jgi:hypothetical protein